MMHHKDMGSMKRLFKTTELKFKARRSIKWIIDIYVHVCVRTNN